VGRGEDRGSGQTAKIHPCYRPKRRERNQNGQAVALRRPVAGRTQHTPVTGLGVKTERKTSPLKKNQFVCGNAFNPENKRERGGAQKEEGNSVKKKKGGKAGPTKGGVY